MRVIYEVGSYNDRRYGRPWIGKVTSWPIGKRATIEFGSNVSSYMAEIDAAPGQIVRYGQRDHRKPNRSDSFWGIVQADGKVVQAYAEDCREHWLAGCPVPPRLEDEVINTLRRNEEGN